MAIRGLHINARSAHSEVRRITTFGSLFACSGMTQTCFSAADMLGRTTGYVVTSLQRTCPPTSRYPAVQIEGVQP